MRFQKIIIVGAIIIALLAILWILISALFYEKIPNQLPPKDGYVFDYVIVGAGTAGSVLTSMLAKHSNGSILLVEAGDSFGFLSKIPLLTTFQQQGLNDWAFLSVPQAHSSKGLEKQRQCLPRGKGLGGSALLNFMLHFDGHAPDFDNWHARFNLSEWRWTQMQPFLQAASAKPHESYEIPRSYSKLSLALDDAMSEFAAHKAWTFRRSRYNIKNGLRHSVLQRFLQPELHKRNLRLMTNTLAKKIILTSDGSQVQALQVGIKNEETRKEQLFMIGVRRELIISAGAYQSPQLLQASGIGAAEKLRKANIAPRVQLPEVGNNLHDHLNVPLFVSIEEVGPTLNQGALLDPISLFNYLTSGTGHLGNFGVLGHISDYQREQPFTLTLFGAGAIDESSLMSISNFKRGAFRALFPRYHNATQEGFVLISSCLQPKSRGSVGLTGESMRKNPLIDPNYLALPEDVACTINAIRNAVELITSASFAALKPKIHWPHLRECIALEPTAAADFRHNKPSDAYLECVMRHIGLTSHHPGGTCAMGTHASNSVVDQRLRLHGVHKLRVVDASVLPTPISGNPNTIIAAIALRAASWILLDELIEESD